MDTLTSKWITHVHQIWRGKALITLKAFQTLVSCAISSKQINNIEVVKMHDPEKNILSSYSNRPVEVALAVSVICLLLSSSIVIFVWPSIPATPWFWIIHAMADLFVLLVWILPKYMDDYKGLWGEAFSMGFRHRRDSGMTQLITQSSTGLSGSTASVLKIPGRVQSSRVWTANVFNTVIIATITSIVIPFLFYFLWRPAILNTMIVINRDEIPSAYYPSFAVLQNIDWSSQAQLTLDSSPKCFVGWMKDNLPACADVADDVRGAWCNCTANWDETIEDFTWHDSRYKMLSWTTTADMVNMEPTVPILAQAFFNYNTTKAFDDSYSNLSPSLWLAIWDPNLTLDESLIYGYTRLQLIDALGMSSVNLGLNYKSEPGKKSAYDYDLATITTVPETSMTCDEGSDNYYGPCYITLLVQFPTFGRQVTTVQKEMSWPDVAAAVGSWLSLFQLLSWIISLQAFQA